MLIRQTARNSLQIISIVYAISVGSALYCMNAGSPGLNLEALLAARQQDPMANPVANMVMLEMLNRLDNNQPNGARGQDGQLGARLLGNPSMQAINRGWNQALFSASYQAFGELFKGVPEAFKRSTGLLAAYAYRLSFGSSGLTWNNLAKISNRIHFLCLPFTNVTAGAIDKKRRAELVGIEQGIAIVESNWQSAQHYIIRELRHAQQYLKEALPCYDLAFTPKAPYGLKIKLARIIQALSAQDNKQISFYLIETVSSLEELLKLFESFKSFDEAQQKHEQIKRWLSWTCNSFEQIALLLEGENTSRAGRILFSKLSAQNQAAMPTLDALLGAALPMGNQQA